MKPSLNDEEQYPNEIKIARDSIMKTNAISTSTETSSTTSMSINNSSEISTALSSTNNLKRKNIDNDDEELVEPKTSKALAGRKLKSEQKQEQSDCSSRLKTRQSKANSHENHRSNKSSDSSPPKTRSQAAKEASIKVNSLADTGKTTIRLRSKKNINNCIKKESCESKSFVKPEPELFSSATSEKSDLETDSTEKIITNISSSKLTPALMEEPYESNKLVAQLYTNDQTTENWLNTFKEWNNKYKLSALEKILELCDHTHIKHVHNYIEPKLQRDYISELPRELILLLLTYVRPKDLYKLAQVSHYWHQIANDPILWKNICKRNKIDLNNIVNKKSMNQNEFITSNSLNNSKSSRQFHSKTSYYMSVEPNRIFSQNTSNDQIDVGCGSIRSGKFYDEIDYLDPNDLDSDLPAGLDYDETDRIDDEFGGTELDSVAISRRQHQSDAATTSKATTSKTSGAASTSASNNGYCSPSSPSSHSSEPNLASKSTDSSATGTSAACSSSAEITADQSKATKQSISGSNTNNNKVVPINTARDPVKRRRLSQLVKYSSIKSIISKTIHSVCNGDSQPIFLLPKSAKSPLNTILESFNAYKRAYLIDYNVTKNWCTRALPRPFILRSHDEHVITCLKFDGFRVVSGSDDCTLKVWCALTSKLLHTLVGHTGGVWASQLKDNIVISGSTDRSVRVWNIDTGECIHVLTGHTSTVRCLALNGNIVVSGSRDSLLRVWNIETGQCMHILRGHVAAVRCVCFDGKYVVSGSYDFTIRVWNPFKNECLHVLEGHSNRVYSLLFDGNRIVSGSLDTTIIVWNVHSGQIIHKLTGHHSLTSGMQIKGDILVSGNADSTVKIWSLKTGECLHTLSGYNKHMSAVTCLAFNEKFVVSSSDDGTVKLWNLETGEFIRNLLGLDSGGRGGVVWRISMHKNKLVCAVGSRIGVEETKLILLDFDWPPLDLTEKPATTTALAAIAALPVNNNTTDINGST